MKRTLAVWRTCAASVALCVALGASPMKALAQQADADSLVSDPIAVQEEDEQTIKELAVKPAEEPKDETLQEDSTLAGTPAVATGTTTDTPATGNTPATDGEPAEGPCEMTTPAEGKPSEADPVQGTEGQTAEGQEPAATGPDADPAQDQGWVREGGATYYYRGGAPLTGEQLLPREDGGGEAWFWLGSDGAMVRSADVYVPVEGGGKWVRLGADGAMLTGEHYANDPAGGHVGWYHFDEQTRAMSFGLTELAAGKTVFYDRTTGVMRYGEHCVDGSWYLFEQNTGAMAYGWRWLAAGGKWVHYDLQTGRMNKGECYVTDGEPGWCYFDEVTGAVQYGWKRLASDGGKWVHYDLVTGRMNKGECYVTDGEPGWCYFSSETGEIQYGLQYLAWSDKVVYYDRVTGRMRYGWQQFGNANIYFDPVTGSMQSDGFNVLARAMVVEGLGAPDASVVDILHGNQKRVRIIGDSISGGWGVASPVVCDGVPIVTDSNGTYYEPSSRPPTWANSLREIVSSRGGELFNASVPTKGFGWFDGLGAKLPDNGHDRFDLTVFMLGTNDRLQDPEVLTESVRSVIDKAMATSDSVVVVIPEPVCYLPLQESGADMVGQVLCSVCEEKGVPTIDALALFERTASMAGYSNSDLYSDGVHPSTSGQIVLWSIVSNGLGIW